MGWDDILKIVGMIGGITVISGGVATFVGNFILSRFMQSHQAKLNVQLETHKDFLLRDADRNRLLLKRQELMFEKEYAAAADFYRIFNSVVPAPWAPELDWAEAQTRISENFGTHEESLKKFLMQHAASLSEDARKLIEKAQATANAGGFETAYETDEGEYGTGELAGEKVCKYVDEFCDRLKEADYRIRLDLKEGSFSTMTNANKI